MPLQSSGPLKFSDIEREFGQSIVRSLGEYRISKNIGDMSNIPLDEGIGQVGDNGTANTGGGGGGPSSTSSANGATGGSGIVVIRYKFQ